MKLSPKTEAKKDRPIPNNELKVLEQEAESIEQSEINIKDEEE